MKTLLITAIFAFSLVARADGLASLDFLRGCWGYRDGGTHVTEDWSRRSDNVMLGVSQTIDADRQMLSHEFLTIRLSQGKISYLPIFDGQVLAPFLYSASESRAQATAVFHNSKRDDFPESITYSKSGDALHIALAGQDETGKALLVEFEMAAESCSSRY